ncbi:GNAT family N-acetyltransferase [Actinomadura roseirufa]|uniref:GNAT family N-acetyltransferase n=1 Tax=Actinomadura roseirufa TaxID=2094049 RepID=UPI0010416EBA|nr:GNAT family N-acetyltransferase [Actinomadura roseirufa]
MPDYDRFRRDVVRVQGRHPDVELHLVWTGPDDPVVLDVIRTLPVLRGRGLAEAALREVTALADAWGAALRLVVEPIEGNGDVDPARLARWYARHGFVVTGPPRDGREPRSSVPMHRPPRTG